MVFRCAYYVCLPFYGFISQSIYKVLKGFFRLLKWEEDCWKRHWAKYVCNCKMYCISGNMIIAILIIASQYISHRGAVKALIKNQRSIFNNNYTFHETYKAKTACSASSSAYYEQLHTFQYQVSNNTRVS